MDLPAAYVAMTEGVLHRLSLSHEAGHVLAGLILYVAVFSVIRARLAPVLAFLAVLLAELFNESVQAAYYRSWRVHDTLADIGWTLVIPAFLTVSALLLPALLRGAGHAMSMFLRDPLALHGRNGYMGRH